MPRRVQAIPQRIRIVHQIRAVQIVIRAIVQEVVLEEAVIQDQILAIPAVLVVPVTLEEAVNQPAAAVVLPAAVSPVKAAEEAYWEAVMVLRLLPMHFSSLATHMYMAVPVLQREQTVLDLQCQYLRNLESVFLVHLENSLEQERRSKYPRPSQEI